MSLSMLHQLCMLRSTAHQQRGCHSDQAGVRRWRTGPGEEAEEARRAAAEASAPPREWTRGDLIGRGAFGEVHGNAPLLGMPHPPNQTAVVALVSWPFDATSRGEAKPGMPLLYVSFPASLQVYLGLDMELGQLMAVKQLNLRPHGAGRTRKRARGRRAARGEGGQLLPPPQPPAHRPLPGARGWSTSQGTLPADVVMS